MIPNNSQIAIFCSKDGQVEMNVKLENETVWLSQAQMAQLFDKDRTVIGRHINNIFREGELEKELVCAKFAHTTKHGAIKGKEQEKEIMLYNLDVIISVGYRVHSQRGVQFRQWSNSILKEYLVKGYAVNKKRLDHYDELKNVVRLMSRAISLQHEASSGEYSGLFNALSLVYGKERHTLFHRRTQAYS